MDIFDDLPHGSPKYVDTTKEFLNSNNLVAQIVIFILIIILFVVLIKVGTWLISFFLSPSANPIVLPGLNDARKLQRIQQDPKIPGSIPILRSHDQFNGLEFTWSVWINIDGVEGSQENKYKHVFNKGNYETNPDGIVFPNNAPGLYISPVNYPVSQELSLLVRMNIFTNQSTTMGLPVTQDNNECIYTAEAQGLPASSCPATQPLIYDDIEVPGIPINKWINVIIRCNTSNILDVYINGRLVKRHKLRGVVRQNYDDVFVSLNGGFPGFISNLRYFNYAVGTAEIDNIVSNGPNLKAKSGTDLTASSPYYLANQWFFNETDPIYSPSIYT
jgi:hypothetical protein